MNAVGGTPAGVPAAVTTPGRVAREIPVWIGAVSS
jgi:hypothetical protein